MWFDGVNMKIFGDDVIIEKEGGFVLLNWYLCGGIGIFSWIVDFDDVGLVEFVLFSIEGFGVYCSWFGEF